MLWPASAISPPPDGELAADGGRDEPDPVEAELAGEAEVVEVLVRDVFELQAVSCANVSAATATVAILISRTRLSFRFDSGGLSWSSRCRRWTEVATRLPPSLKSWREGSERSSGSRGLFPRRYARSAHEPAKGGPFLHGVNYAVGPGRGSVSYTHLRAHETGRNLV